MKPQCKRFAAVLLSLLSFQASATTRYVNVNSASPMSPYTSWATAAATIQDAANVAVTGDLILVTNGVYQTGGSAAIGRVFIQPPIKVQSVNGPAVTIINGAGVMRCAELSSGVTLSGFTLANGAALTHSGGGVYCLATSATMINCIFTNNSATVGGGALSGTFSNCTFVGNIATNYGGGVYGGTINQCSFISNSAGYYGGGAFQSSLNNCAVVGNRSGNVGGAASTSTLINCTVVSNSAAGSSGGADSGSMLKNCIVYYNSPDNGSGNFTNCCTTPLPSSGANNITNAPGFVNLAGGDFHLQIGSPCINAGNNSFISNPTDLDGNPRIVGGTVDIGAYENQYAGVVHYVSLSSTNPLPPYTNWITAATNIQDAVGVALAGDFVVAANGIYLSGGAIVYGQLTNRVALTNAITLLGLYGSQSTAIVGSVLGYQIRCVYVGSNAVLNGFSLVNGLTRNSGDIIKEQSGGGAWCEMSGIISNCVFGGNNFPYANGGNPSDTCSAQMQGGGVYGGTVYNSTLAINHAPYGGAAAAASLFNCLIETNNYVGSGFCGGIYQGMASNCTFIGNSAFASGGGGGYQSALYNCTLTGNQGGAGGTYGCTNYNCMLANNSGTSGGGAAGGILYNCILSNNTASSYGGGAYQSTLNYCTLTGNQGNAGGTYGCTNYNCTLANNSGINGGGASGGILYNCIVSSNTAASSGGGVFLSTLYNCTISSNSAADGGGAYQSDLFNCIVVGNRAGFTGGVLVGTLYNSIVYYNYSSEGASNFTDSTMSFCDTMPLASGFGNITNEPAFVNLSGGDFHLQSNSPCINSGNNAYVSTTNDLDGNPRIVGGTVDIGAYEFQTPGSIISYAWLQQYGLPTDGTADFADPDHDGMNNWQEWKAGTNPTNAASVLQLLSPSNSVSGMTVSWQSVSGVTYYLQRSTNLSAQPAFSAIQSNIVGQTGTTSYTDTNAIGTGPFFYRVGVQ
ncbi:MAG: choice-of-anchor Q domain-containing protein [Verrucomicrobiia bacterium]